MNQCEMLGPLWTRKAAYQHSFSSSSPFLLAEDSQRLQPLALSSSTSLPFLFLQRLGGSARGQRGSRFLGGSQAIAAASEPHTRTSGSRGFKVSGGGEQHRSSGPWACVQAGAEGHWCKAPSLVSTQVQPSISGFGLVDFTN